MMNASVAHMGWKVTLPEHDVTGKYRAVAMLPFGKKELGERFDVLKKDFERQDVTFKLF